MLVPNPGDGGGRVIGMNDEQVCKTGRELDREVQKQFRLVLGRKAIEALDNLVAFVNDGFASGSVSRVQLAGYIFENAKRYLNKSELVKLRQAFFDERKALDQIIRESDSTGKLPEEIRKILQSQFRASEGISK